MAATRARHPVKVLVALTYLLMVAVNILANALPLNGTSTGDVSDAYSNLFAPAGYAFSIWGVIYLLLGLHVLYQFGLFHTASQGTGRAELLNKVGWYFSISSLANTAWVFAWHYDLIAVSVALIVVILICLAAVSQTVRAADPPLRDRLFVGVPFSVYFGWTTVATVANVTVLLVSLDWDGFGVADSDWTIAVLLLAMAIGTATMLRNRDIAYGLVLIWAYVAILVKHISAGGFDSRYPYVIATVTACLLVYVVAGVVIVVRRRAGPARPAPATRDATRVIGGGGGI